MAEIKVADLVAEIKLRDEKFKREIDGLRRNVDRNTDRMVSDFKKVSRKGLISFKRLAAGAAAALGGILAFVAARGLFRGFQKIIGLASDTTESMNKVKEVFGKSADSVVKFSEKAAVSLGASREQALAMTGSIGNLLTAMGATEEVAAGMSTKIVQLGADLGSFNNVGTEEALIAIRAALIGETEPMRRFGSNVSAARVQALALAKGIDKATLETNEFMKSQLRLEIIFKDTQKAQGDFARTSNDFANLMKTLTSLFSDAGSKLGTALIPKITELARVTKAFVTSSKFNAFLDGLTIKFGLLADVIGRAVKGLVAWVTVGSSQDKLLAQFELTEKRIVIIKKRIDELEAGNLFQDMANAPAIAQMKTVLHGLEKDLERIRKQFFVGPPLPPAGVKPEPGKSRGSAKDEPGTGTAKAKRDAPTFKTSLGELEKTLKRLQDEADKADQAIADSLDEAADAAGRLDDRLKGVAEQLGAAINSGEDFIKVLVRIGFQQLALQFAGPVGIAASFLSAVFAGGGGGRVG